MAALVAIPRSQAVEAAGRIFARVAAEMDLLTVEEAARRAWCAGGPPVEELADRIRAMRTPQTTAA